MVEPLMRVDQLSYQYPDGREALHDVSFTIYAGERVGLIGPNGAGKSTLLLHLNGVLRGTGQIAVAGLPLNDRTVGQIRALVGLVFQNPDDQLFSTTVYQDVAFGPLHMGLPETEVKGRVDRALEAVGMGDAHQRISMHLSGGEKKRVAIATVLSMQPQILVLDEPSAGLDPRGWRSLITLLTSLEQQTLLMSTHDMRLVNRLCTRVILLDDGRIVADGSTHDLLRNTDLMEEHGLESSP